MMTTPERFEDRLLRELRRVVEERPAPAATAEPRARRTRLAWGGVGVGVATATVVVAIVASSGDVTPSAYAVQPQADGEVTVSIHSLSDAAGLQSELRAAGIPAVVSYTTARGAGCLAPGADLEPGVAIPVSGGTIGSARRIGRARRDPVYDDDRQRPGDRGHAGRPRGVRQCGDHRLERRARG